MAIGLIKDCYKEKIEILTSQAAVNHALDFIDKTSNQIKEELNQDMQKVREQDMTESAAIRYAIENNPEIQSQTGVSTESLSSSHSPERAEEEQ
jgi:excinuclease UvrABC nuclease subunit